MKKQEALNQTVFHFNNENEIEETTLYAHIMESEDQTTTPRGVGPRIHIRENEEDGTYEIWTWGVNGNNSKFIETFDTRKDAEQDLKERE